MAHPKKLVSTVSDKSSSKAAKSSKKERQEVEDATIEVTFSTNNPVDIESGSQFAENLSGKEEVLSIDNSVIEDLNEDLSGSTCKRLVLVGTDSLKIQDEDGSVFPTLLSKLADAASIRTLVLTGHDFSLLHIPAEFPENLTTLVFDNCNIDDIEFEENAAASLDTLVFQKINSLSSFSLPAYACASLSKLKLSRMVCKTITIEDEAMADGVVLEIGSCKYLEEVTVGDDSFLKGENLIMSRNTSLISMTIGANCFQEASVWNAVNTELRSLTLKGNNFTNLEEVDFTPMPELSEVVLGEGVFLNSLTLICEELTKLKHLEFGDNCFQSGKKIYLINTANIRQLLFGKRCFRAMHSEDFTICDLTKLETLEFGEGCLAKMERFVLLKNQCLKSVRFGKNCLKNCQYFVLLNYLNRVHVEEHEGKITFIPEEYPGLPQEAEILCQPGSFRIEVCPRLTSVEFAKDCLPAIKHFEMSYLRRLKHLILPEHFAEDCETFSMSDNPKLTDLEIPQSCFKSCKYFSLQNHPELQSLVVDRNVMSNGGFAIMRNLYPTTISVDQKSFLLTAASYKSIPNKLRRAITKNLTKFQAKIASDAFLGQALVETIGVVGIIAVVIILMA